MLSSLLSTKVSWIVLGGAAMILATTVVVVVQRDEPTPTPVAVEQGDEVTPKDLVDALENAGDDGANDAAIEDMLDALDEATARENEQSSITGGEIPSNGLRGLMSKEQREKTFGPNPEED